MHLMTFLSKEKVISDFKMLSIRLKLGRIKIQVVFWGLELVYSFFSERSKIRVFVIEYTYMVRAFKNMRAYFWLIQ